VDQLRLDWAADTTQSDDAAYAGRVQRSMVVRLGEVARAGVRDPGRLVAPFGDALLTIRARARQAKDFATSDEIRDGLVDAGVEVRDTPTGVEWSFAPPVFRR
jgi:cysteinyl-tRNA synthetase